MKLRHKILFILIVLVGLFAFSGNKTFATYYITYSNNGTDYNIGFPDIPEQFDLDNYNFAFSAIPSGRFL